MGFKEEVKKARLLNLRTLHKELGYLTAAELIDELLEAHGMERLVPKSGASAASKVETPAPETIADALKKPSGQGNRTPDDKRIAIEDALKAKRGSTEAIAKEFGVSGMTVHNIKKRLGLVNSPPAQTGKPQAKKTSKKK